MTIRPYLAPLAVLALVGTSPTAAAQGFGARSKAMGGTSVASSKSWIAPLNNPALLALARKSDDFGLVIPTFSVEARNGEEFIDDLEDFTDQFDNIDQQFEDVMNGGDLPTQEELDDLADSLLDLGGEDLFFSADGGIALTVPNDSLGIGIMIRGRAEGVGLLEISEADANAIRDTLDNAMTNLPDLESAALVRAGVRSEVGVAFASQFEIAGLPISFGITPKAQSIETFNYVTTADDFEEDDDGDNEDFTDDEFRDDESVFNFDLGFAAQPIQNLTVGLTITDLISQDVESVVTDDTQFTYSIEPVATVGAAWSTGTWTFAADLDLNKREPFEFTDGSQFLGVGAELAGSWAQLRAGYRMDLDDGTEDVFTGGLGFSPFQMLRVELAGLVGDDTYGAAIELSLTF